MEDVWVRTLRTSDMPTSGWQEKKNDNPYKMA